VRRASAKSITGQPYDAETGYVASLREQHIQQRKLDAARREQHYMTFNGYPAQSCRRH
jgi:hypothetical protein